MNEQTKRKSKRYCGPCDKWVPASQAVCKACGADTDKAETRQLYCGICGRGSGNTDLCVSCATRLIQQEPW